MDRIGYFFARVLLWSLAHGPFALARFYSVLLDSALPRLRRVALHNLAFAYPEKSPAERARVADRVFACIARLLWTFARLPSITPANVSHWIRCEGLENYLAGKENGRGVLVATAHLGNWELSAFAHALLTEPMNIVYRPLDDPRIDALVETRRALSGNRLINKREAPRAILKALDRNEAVGVLIDQNTSLQEGVFIDFFGQPACASVAFAKLAARTGAAVVPGFALWSDEEQRYILRFYPRVPITGDPARDTQAIHRVLEQIIREDPGQWLWIHRRWKTRPPGEPPLY